jgi:hypothetical protein
MTSQGDPNPARRAYRDLDQLEQTTTDPGRRPRRKWGVRVTDPASNSRVSEPGGGSARCSQSCLSSQRQSRYGTIVPIHRRRQRAPAPRSQHRAQPGRAARQTPGQHDNSREKAARRMRRAAFFLGR